VVRAMRDLWACQRLGQPLEALCCLFLIVVFDSLGRTATQTCEESGNEERRDDMDVQMHLNKVLCQVLVLILRG
jgi:hypothetical protein